MYHEIESHARKLIAEKLELITENQFLLFKRMYCFDNLEATKNNASILILTEKIDGALRQLDNTIIKNKSK